MRAKIQVLGQDILVACCVNISPMAKESKERFLMFSLRVRDFSKKIKWDLINTAYIHQLIRSSASVGANYLEAGDNLGKADERMKIKIARREAKESVYWLRLIFTNNDNGLEEEKAHLIEEGTQIQKILSAIILKL